MIQPTPELLEKLVIQLFDDLIDECSVKHQHMLNGTRNAARTLVKDTIQVKQELIDRVRSLRELRDANNIIEFKRLNTEVRYQSLRILERMRELGI